MTSHIFQIAVCDDDLNDLKETEQSTREICFEENICACFVSYENSLALLNDLKEGKKFDLLLLDVLMPDLNSMELARCLRESKQNTSIYIYICKSGNGFAGISGFCFPLSGETTEKR